MSFRSLAASALVASLAAAAPAPAPQATRASSAASSAASGAAMSATAGSSQFSSASASASMMMSSAMSGAIPTAFGTASAVAFSAPQPSVPIEQLRSSQVTGATSHGPYAGPAATVTGAVQNGPAAKSIPALPPNPTATYYNTNGLLSKVEPAPYTPAGGLGTNGTEPRYMVESDYDYESIQLGLYQEWIELDLFNNGLAVFSEQDFLDAGLTVEDRDYINFMADQETGHATLLSNMLGETAAPQCTYNYPFTTVREFIDFNQRLTRWGESGVWGYVNHLDSREVGQLLAQSIATEARQQLSFRQMAGLHPQSVWFEAGIPQSWSWTYLAPYISTCPAHTTRLAWQNFPGLHIVNNANINRLHPNDTKNFEVTGRRIGDPSNSTIPEAASCVNVNVTGYGCGPAISRNKTEPLSFAGKKVFFEWDNAGLPVGPNNSYVTSTTAGNPTYAMWVNQLNATYSPLTMTGPNAGYTFQPNGTVYAGDPIINGTMFVALTDSDMYLTPFNLSMINPHVRALGLYQAG